MKNLNQTLVENIAKRIPPHTKIVSYLMDTLRLGKDPAYKRMRGIVPFSLEEVSIIAANLSFSIDAVLMQQGNSHMVAFEIPVDLEKDSIETYVNLLEVSIATIKEMKRYDDYKITIATNIIPWYFFPFPLLFKIAYCRYLNERNELPYGSTFENIVVPEQILSLWQENYELFMNLNNVTCICSQDIIEKSIHRINYLKQRDFLTQNDLTQIQQELYSFLDKMLNLNLAYNDNYSNFRLYISEDMIDGNGIYYRYGNERLCAIYHYPEMPIFIKNNPLIWALHKKWINARIKFSTLLTQNNELELFRYTKKSQAIIATLTNEEEKI